MERQELVNEIVDFCIEHEFLFYKQAEAIAIKTEMDHRLQDIEFVEDFIHLLIIKTKNRKNMNITKLKRILLGLEKVRLELEYDGDGEEYKISYWHDNDIQNEEVTTIKR